MYTGGRVTDREAGNTAQRLLRPRVRYVSETTPNALLGLNEAQERVVQELGATSKQRPVFPDGLAAGLRARLATGLRPVAANLNDGDNLFISKFLLSQVLGCEARHIHELQREFAWSVPVARGTVAHKAIELSVHWRTLPIANELVDQAIATLTNDGSPIADYLLHLPEAERAQLRSEAANSTQAFLDGFPPLGAKPQWRPAVEVRGRYEFLDSKLVLSGKVDLSLGGPTGDRSGRVFIDLKTGRRSRTHVDDLRFYALIETVRYGTPPRALASYYLDESRLSVELCPRICFGAPPTESLPASSGTRRCSAAQTHPSSARVLPVAGAQFRVNVIPARPGWPPSTQTNSRSSPSAE